MSERKRFGRFGEIKADCSLANAAPDQRGMPYWMGSVRLDSYPNGPNLPRSLTSQSHYKYLTVTLAPQLAQEVSPVGKK